MILSKRLNELKVEEKEFLTKEQEQFGIEYTVVNTDNHVVKIGIQANFPFYDSVSVSIGAEYGFLDMVIAAIIVAGFLWGVPYLQSAFFLKNLRAELQAVQNGEIEVNYFRRQLDRARTIIADTTALGGGDRRGAGRRLRSRLLKAPT